MWITMTDRAVSVKQHVDCHDGSRSLDGSTITMTDRQSRWNDMWVAMTDRAVSVEQHVEQHVDRHDGSRSLGGTTCGLP